MNKDFPNTYEGIEIDVFEQVCDSHIIDDYIRLQELQQRRLFLTKYINQESVTEIIKPIMQYNRDDRDIPVEDRIPIMVYVATNGGEIDAGFALVDVIQNSATPVYTINFGYMYSMGFLIGLSGHKRYALPSSKFLMHDGWDSVLNSATKIYDYVDFTRRMEDRIKRYVLSKTLINDEEYDQKLRVEWYMFADEAKEKGIVDYIVGEDCTLDNII